MFFIFLILRALRNVWFVLQTLHKLYIKLYIEPRKPYTNASANPTQNGAQTLHCNGAQFYLGALLSRIRGRERKTRGRERKTRGRLGEGKEKFEEGKLKFEEGK